MRYFGGKSRVAKKIVSYLESQRKKDQKFIEPFVGGANIVSRMVGDREAYDINSYLIELYKNLQNGYNLPDYISEEDYKYVKSHLDENPPLTAFVGFGCSYAGKWFGGYARGEGRNFAAEAKRSILKKMSTMENVIFKCCDYKTLHLSNCLIYCDPPYKGTTKYNGVPDFDHKLFWEIMRKWSINNDVFISEYDAPDDFECVLSIPTKTQMRDTNGNHIDRIEKLYRYKNI